MSDAVSDKVQQEPVAGENTGAEDVGGNVAVGGQAVIGGVLMRRGPRWCVAVRRGDGEIVTRSGDVATGRWASKPLLRGVLGIWSGLRLGSGALVWSARQQTGEDEAGRWVLGLAAVVPVVVFGAVFMAVPAALAGAVGGPQWASLVLEGVVRLAMVIGYIWGVGRMGHIAEVFGYHGAEHRVVNCFEAGGRLDVATCQRYPVVHQRCGTSFVVVVVAVSQLVFAFAPHEGLARVGARVVGLPLVAAFAYELLRVLAANQGRRWAQVASRPGLWVQGLTTNEPRDDQVEVAMVAMKGCL